MTISEEKLLLCQEEINKMLKMNEKELFDVYKCDSKEQALKYIIDYWIFIA